MTTRRSELHDDLRAVIAAGRELSPEDDTLLADVFLDRMGHKIESRRNPQPIAVRTMRRWAGAAALILALLTGGAFVSIRGASHQGESSCHAVVGHENWVQREGSPRSPSRQLSPSSRGACTKGRTVSAEGLITEYLEG